MKQYFRDCVCSNCGSTDFDGHDCNDCGFDADCYGANFD